MQVHSLISWPFKRGPVKAAYYNAAWHMLVSNPVMSKTAAKALKASQPPVDGLHDGQAAPANDCAAGLISQASKSCDVAFV